MKFFDRFTRQQKQKAEQKKEEERIAKSAVSLPKAAKTELAGRLSHVLVRPHITEKAGRAAEKNQYIFQVARRSTKPEIGDAFEALYGIKPTAIQVVNIPRKARRLGRFSGFKSGYKKAIISLPKGKTIELMPR